MFFSVVSVVFVVVLGPFFQVEFIFIPLVDYEVVHEFRRVLDELVFESYVFSRTFFHELLSYLFHQSKLFSVAFNLGYKLISSKNIMFEKLLPSRSQARNDIPQNRHGLVIELRSDEFTD